MSDLVPPLPVRLALHTSDGLALQAELSVPKDEVRAAVVLSHPHPLHGGSMNASVIEALFRALPRHGAACLRFNFRGVQGSRGRHGGGGPERADVIAAVDEVSSRYPVLPVLLAGWSFGGDVSLAVDDERVAAWFAVAPPLRVLPPEELVAGPSDRPVTLVVPAHDQFCPPDLARSRTEGWRATRIEVVDMADHFLTAHVPEVVDAARRAVDRVVA